MAELKSAKEAFVSGLLGTTIVDVSACLAVLVTSYALYRLLELFLPHFQYGKHSKLAPLMPLIFLELAVLLVPIWLAFTVAADDLLRLHISLAIPICGLLVYHKAFNRSSSAVLKSDSKQKEPPQPNRLVYLVAFRGMLQYITILAILAVDFHVFPRRYAKTENYGVSIMDAGVGSFIFSMGIVSGSRLKSTVSLKNKWIKSIRAAAPVLLLGIVRAIATKSVNYQEHLSEYGVHWNFFFTLAFIPLGVTAVTSFTPSISFRLLGILVAIGYEVALKIGLEAYINDPRRRTLIDMNKEGIFSLSGYLAIFLFSADLGIRCGVDRSLVKTPRNALKTLLLEAGVFVAVTACFRITAIESYFPISRRLTNLSYIVWIMATNATILLGMYLVDEVMIPWCRTASPPSSRKNRNGKASPVKTEPPIVLSSINRNQLSAFLLANLLTGLVNMSSNTLEASNTFAMVVLFGYLSVVLGAALLMDVVFNITLKL
ncbi:GPI-anchored wall transfer protein [Cladochytrium replicatum]|nr:GPI-anchored wall transfer protein [Cladochytrium replicatum]